MVLFVAARTLDCPCPPQPLTTVGEGDAWGFFWSDENAIGAEASAEAERLAVEGARDAVNRVECASGCRKALADVPIVKGKPVITRAWFGLIIRATARAEKTVKVSCVVSG